MSDTEKVVGFFLSKIQDIHLFQSMYFFKSMYLWDQELIILVTFFNIKFKCFLFQSYPY